MFGKAVLVMGYAANDLVEPNCFTGDYFYCKRTARSSIETIKDIIYECISRYRQSHKQCPKSMKVLLSVRDCSRKYRVGALHRPHVTGDV